MKALFDTSTLIAAMVAVHSKHDVAFPWLRKALAGEMEMQVCTYSLAELFAVLTRLPVKPKIHPSMALRMIRENVARVAHMVALTVTDYKAVMQSQAELGLDGGRIYDALIAKAAEKSEAEMLLTLNAKDFLLVWPEGKGIIREL